MELQTEFEEPVKKETTEEEVERLAKENRLKLQVEQAAKRKFGLISAREKAILKDYPEEQHPAILAFMAFSQGKKWSGGIQAKMAAKGAFIEAFKIAALLYLPEAIAEVEKKNSTLILPPGL